MISLEQAMASKAAIDTASNNGQPLGQVNAKSKPAVAFLELGRKISGRQVAARKKKKGLLRFVNRS